MISQADVIAYVLADLVLILVAARMLGRAASALRQPRVAGEIAAGILIGPTLLGGHVGTDSTEGAGLVDRLYPAEAFAFLSLIGQIGLVLYMFLVGIALDRRALRRRKRQIGVVATATGVAPIALGFAAAPLFDSSAWRPLGVGDLTFSLFLAAGLAATALPILARLLQEKGLVATPVGVITVGVAGLVTVIAFLLVAAGSASATGGGVVVDVVLRLGLAVSFTLLLLLIVRPVLGFADKMNSMPKHVASTTLNARVEQLEVDRGRCRRWSRSAQARGRRRSPRRRQPDAGAHADRLQPRRRVPPNDLPGRAGAADVCSPRDRRRSC